MDISAIEVSQASRGQECTVAPEARLVRIYQLDCLIKLSGVV